MQFKNRQLSWGKKSGTRSQDMYTYIASVQYSTE